MFSAPQKYPVFPVECSQRDTQDWTPSVKGTLCKTVVERFHLNSSSRHRSKVASKLRSRCSAMSSTTTAGSDVVQSGRPIFDDFFQHLWPYIGNNTANVVFQMVKRLWLIRIDQ
ncbi:hypothetical protein TNCV_3042781 [Trichonephila clavipes]|nr:hypothetical protein TNCV_3042781 [Trichonephila clavipes]